MLNNKMTAAAALAVALLLPAAARASLVQWTDALAAGTPVSYLATHIVTPSRADIGALTGDISYEFIVNGGDRAAAGSLLGSLSGGQSQAIRFEQSPNTGEYGVTQYYVDDYVFGVPTSYDVDVQLAFVVDSLAGTTALFVNGVDTGARVPVALSLAGNVAFGGTDLGGSFLGDDAFAGEILGFAAYDSALSAAEVQAHADAFFDAASVVPEPATLALVGCGLIALVGPRGRGWAAARRVGAGC